MAAMRHLAQIDQAPVTVVPKRTASPRTIGHRRAWRLAALSLLIASSLPVGALAQLSEPLSPVPVPPSGPQAPAAPGEPVYAGQTVTTRPRPELDPLGLHVGDFFWFPRAELDEAYNNNIFATSNLTTSDFITALQPAFDLLSNFSRHALNLRGGAVSQFYARHPAQNTNDGFIALDGRLDVSAGSAFLARAQAAHLHLPRTSPDSPGNAAEPVTYNAYGANLGYSQSGLRFGYQADMAVQNTQYNGVPLVGGGILPQSSQDLTYSQAALRGNYELIPDYLGYVRVSGNLSEYQHTIPGGIRFNSKGYRADFGLQILPRHILSGEVYAGYLSQIYRIGGSISALDAGGRLVYYVTPLTTANFTGLRTIVPSNPSVTGTGNGYLATTVSGSVDHELLRNLLLNAAISYENDAYLGISRTDNVLSTGLGVKYLVNRNFYLGGTYTFQQRNSTLAGSSYSQSIFMVRASTQF
jgi:hypothetical protein